MKGGYLFPPVPRTDRMGDYLVLQYIPHKGPLAYVAAVWEAPALRTYPAAVRRLLLQLLAEDHLRYGPGGVHKALLELGWEWHWETTLDSLFLVARGLVEGFPRALELLYEAVAEPVLEGPTVRLEVERLAEAQRRAYAHLPYRAESYLAERLWGASYAVFEATPPETIASLELASLKLYWEAFLCKGLRYLVVAAPGVPRAIYRWESLSGPLAYEIPLAARPLSVQRVEETAEAQQVSLRVAYPWVRPSAAQYGAYQLALFRLGGYFGSLLMQNLREEAGLTYGVYARALSAQAAAYFVIAAEVDRHRIEEALHRIESEVRTWSENPFPSEEVFQEVQRSLLLRLEVEGLSEWISRLAHLLGRGLSAADYVAQMEAIASYRWADWPRLSLPKEAQVTIAVGTPRPIFAGACA